MSDLRMVVCVKVVPKSEEIRVDPHTLRLDRDTARSEINPPDMNAMELALSLKDAFGGRVEILSMGPPSFEPYLRACLAMGADHITLLSDRNFAGADTLATTYTLARGLQKKGGADLVFCGEESADGATGQVPSGLAEWLGYNQLTLVKSVELDLQTGWVRGRRNFAGGYHLLEVPLPAVISVKTAANEPRFMDYQIKNWAFEQAPVTIWTQADLEVEADHIGIAGSPTVVSGLKQAPTHERRRELLHGTPEEIAQQLASILQSTLR